MSLSAYLRHQYESDLGTTPHSEDKDTNANVSDRQSTGIPPRGDSMTHVLHVYTRQSHQADERP